MASPSIKLFWLESGCVRSLLLLLLLSLAAVLSMSTACAQTTPSQSPASSIEKRITSGSGVNFRLAPAPSAEALARLPIGTVVDVLERATVDLPKAGTVWAKVRLADGREGWIVQSFSLIYTEASRLKVTQEILKTRLAAPDNVSFQDWADLLNFVDAAIKGTTGADAASLELARFQVLALAAGAVPLEKAAEEPFGSWLRKNTLDIVHNEPAGVFIVRADRVWELEAKYHALPMAESIAWFAAETALPGECEGYLPCYLASCRMSEGVYLERHPTGAHAAEAVKRIGAVLSSGTSEDATSLDADTCTELKGELALLKKQVARSNVSLKTKVLAQIDALGARCGTKK